MNSKKLIANPFYCIEIHPVMCSDHKPLISESEWIKANMKLIEDIGSEFWLELLLANLKGDYE